MIQSLSLLFISLNASIYIDNNLTVAEIQGIDINNKINTDDKILQQNKSLSFIKISNNTCTTLACYESALEIINNMNVSVDPCEDFYEFACGNFLNNTIIPDDEGGVNAFSSIHNKVQDQLRIGLEEPILHNESNLFKIAKIFYKSCMNTTAIELRGLEPFNKALNELGGWPVLEGEQWNETNFNWIELTYKLRKIGHSINYFLGFGISSDPMNSTRQIIELDQVSFESENEYLLAKLNEKIDTLSKNHNESNDSFLNIYRNYMIDIAVMLGASRNHVTENEIIEAFEFERELVKISLSPDKRHNATLLYNPMTVANLSIKYSSIPWKEYFNNILGLNTTTIDNDYIVIVNVPSYISNFEKLINTTSKRIQANYVIWRVIESLIPYLTKNILDRQLRLITDLSGITKQEPRWKKCVTESSIFPSVQSLYAKKYFNSDAKNNVIEMVNNIRNQLDKILQTIDWMDNETRNNALDKAASMSTFMAYPDELLDDNKLKETRNDEFEFNDDEYMENMLKIKLSIMDEAMNSIKQPFNKSYWMNHIKVAVVNAFYSRIDNSIEFPAGILQGLFFNNNRPKYLNYGAIGSVIGHEITHGFDNEGRQFDKYGNLINWWMPSTDDKYRRKAKCIIKQYSNYTIDGIDETINGINTLDENIADNGGLKLAYFAYYDWVSRNGDEPILPGLMFNPQQLFWISAANMWCSKVRKEIMRYNIIDDIHSPERFRVIGSFSNLDAFSKDFNCRINSKMNPKNKCTLW